MATATLDSRSNKGWVKLLIESVDVPLDTDDSLLLSTVQSLIPGAHGLYYRDNGVRKALSLDTSNGHVLCPVGGWNAQNIYVHLAHGHRHGINCSMNGEYTKASEIFERNVSAVQKLIASAGLGYGGLRRSDAKNSPKRSTRMKSGFEAQPEEVHISDESDSFLHQQLEAKKKEVEQLTAEKEELTLRLKESESQLDAQRSENDSLRNTLNDTLAQAVPEHSSSPDGTPTTTTNTDKKKKSKKGKVTEDPKDATIQQLQKDLEVERQKNVDLNEQLASSSQHRQMDESGFVETTSDSDERSELQTRIVKLQTEVDAAHKKCADWEAQADSLQTELWSEREQHDYKIQELIEKEEEMNNLHNLIEELRGRVAALQREKGDVEGHLANTQEKLSLLEQRGPKAEDIAIANDRIAHLDQAVSTLQLQLTDAKERLIQHAQKDDLITKLSEEKQKLEWKIGELTQWWNDSKWKIGELEAACERQKEQLAEANEKLNKMIEDTRNVTPSGIHEAIAQPGARATFSVNRQPNTDRWQLASYISAEVPPSPVHPYGAFPAFYPMPAPMPMPYCYPPYAYPGLASPPQMMTPGGETKRVLFEIDAPEAKTVFLAGSFLNWEVALLCRPQGNGRHGVWVDVPRGIYDFKFLVDGEWRASACYPIANNEFGSLNNSRQVE